MTGKLLNRGAGPAGVPAVYAVRTLGEPVGGGALVVVADRRTLGRRVHAVPVLALEPTLAQDRQDAVLNLPGTSARPPTSMHRPPTPRDWTSRHEQPSKNRQNYALSCTDIHNNNNRRNDSF